jgi:hypothetical protein
MQFKVKPLHDSDWTGIHDVVVDGTMMEVIHCKPGAGMTLQPVMSNKTYIYTVTFPALLHTEQGLQIFSVYEIEEVKN